MFLVPPEKKAIHDSRGVLEIWPGRTSTLILFKSLWSCSWWFDMWREASNPLINTIRLFLSFDYPHQPLFNSSQGFHNASGMMCDLLIQSRVMLLGVITAATPWPWAGGQVVPINQSSITSSLSSRDNSGRHVRTLPMLLYVTSRESIYLQSVWPSLKPPVSFVIWNRDPKWTAMHKTWTSLPEVNFNK